jgi:hypothetical protein
LEPFRGRLSPNIDNVSEKLTLRYLHEGPWVEPEYDDARRDGRLACHAVSLHLRPLRAHELLYNSCARMSCSTPHESLYTNAGMNCFVPMKRGASSVSHALERHAEKLTNAIVEGGVDVFASS